MTDRRSRLVVAAIAMLLLAVLSFWLWRSAPPAVPGVARQEAEAPTAPTRTASAAPPQRVTVTSGSSDPLRVTVRPTPSIEGSVVDEQGQPVAGVHLRAELHRSGGMASAWSREDGTFAIHAVDADPRPVRLSILDPGPCKPSWSDDRPWEWGSREVRIVLKRALSFELTVV